MLRVLEILADQKATADITKINKIILCFEEKDGILTICIFPRQGLNRAPLLQPSPYT